MESRFSHSFRPSSIYDSDNEFVQAPSREEQFKKLEKIILSRFTDLPFSWSDPTKKDKNVKGPKATSRNSNRATHLLKTKQGLASSVNDSKVAAMADTGSRKNVMSQSYAKRLDLTIEGSPSTFEIGNSKRIQSIGR